MVRSSLQKLLECAGTVLVVIGEGIWVHENFSGASVRCVLQWLRMDRRGKAPQSCLKGGRWILARLGFNLVRSYGPEL